MTQQMTKAIRPQSQRRTPAERAEVANLEAKIYRPLAWTYTPLEFKQQSFDRHRDYLASLVLLLS